jgi:hypothetical protein
MKEAMPNEGKHNLDGMYWLFHYDENMVSKELRLATHRLNERGAKLFITNFVEEVASDIYTFPFLTKEFCDFICQVSKIYGKWEREEGDNFSAPEARLSKIAPSFDNIVNRMIIEHINPIISLLFGGVYEIGWIGSPFVIKYELETQVEMGLHFDGMSEITISVPISDQFKGGGLFFPRQNYSADCIDVGNAIVFPGGPSHVHKALEITEGERFTLTIWTKNSPP